jgi:uncharacterized membrane protein YfhO
MEWLSEVVKIFLTGFFYFKYLQLKSYSNTICVFGGTSMLFASYLIMNASWFNYFSYAGFLFILWLFSIEKIKEHKPIYFVVSVILTGINQPFDFYFFGVFTLIYLWIDSENYRISFKNLKRLILFGALGVGFAALPIAQNCYALFNGPRALKEYSFLKEISNQSIFQLSNIQEVQTSFLRFFSSNIQGIGDNYGGHLYYVEAPLFFIAGFCVLLLFQKTSSVIVRNKQLILLFSILLLLFFPYLRYTFFVFIGNYYRILGFGIALLLFENGLNLLNDVLNRNITLQKTPIILLFTFYLFCFIIFRDSRPNLIYTKALFVLILNFVVILYFLKKQQKFSVLLLLFVISFSDGFYESYQTLHNRPKVTSKELTAKIGFNDYTLDAINWLKSTDKSIYRIEKDITSGDAIAVNSTNDAMIQNYYGTRLFTSYNHVSYINYLRNQDALEFNTERDTRWVKVPTERIEILNNLGVKYILSKSNLDWTKAGFKQIKVFSNVKIYQNPFYTAFGTIQNNIIAESDFLKQTTETKSQIMNSYMVLPKEEITAISNKTSLEYKLKTDKIGEKQMTITDFKEYKIQGKIFVKEPSFLYFSVPFDKGWKLVDNNEETHIIKANFGMMSVFLQAGEHHISLEYRTPNFWIWVLISIISFSIFLFILFQNRKI